MHEKIKAIKLGTFSSLFLLWSRRQLQSDIQHQMFLQCKARMDNTKSQQQIFLFYSSYIFFFSYLFVRQKICSFPSFLLLHLRSIDEKSTICLVWNKISRRSLGVVKYDFIDSCTYFLCVTLESEKLSYHIFPNKKLK